MKPFCLIHWFAGPRPYPMADAPVFPQDNSANRRPPKRRNSQDENTCAEGYLGESLGELFG